MLRNTGAWGQFPWGALVWSSGEYHIREIAEGIGLPPEARTTLRHEEKEKLQIAELSLAAREIETCELLELQEKIEAYRAGFQLEEKTEMKAEPLVIPYRIEKLEVKDRIWSAVWEEFVEITEKIAISDQGKRVGEAWIIEDPPPIFLSEELRQISRPVFRVFLEIEGKRHEITHDIISISAIDRKLPSRPGEAHRLVAADLHLILDNSNSKYSERATGSIFYEKDYLGAPVEIWLGFQLQE
jgi:hypothetical protein